MALKVLDINYFKGSENIVLLLLSGVGSEFRDTQSGSVRTMAPFPVLLCTASRAGHTRIPRQREAGRIRSGKAGCSQLRSLSGESKRLLEERFRSVPSLAHLADDVRSALSGQGMSEVVGLAVIDLVPERCYLLAVRSKKSCFRIKRRFQFEIL